MGRYLCNTLDEALDSTVPLVAGSRRDFDVIVIGGGSFGSVVANGLFMRDPTRSRRILVLEEGPFVLPEHVQNLPFMGGEPAMRVPWVVRPGSDLGYGFAGLLYAVGGRSMTWGGWSPELLHDEPPGADELVVPVGNNEMVGWPPAVIADLQNRYFYEAGDQIGVNATNDFIYGPLHQALRQMLFAGLGGGVPAAAIPLAALRNHPAVRNFVRQNGRRPTDGELVDMLKLQLPAGGAAPPRPDLLNLLKVEAPLSVQSVADPGLFPVNKFSSIPLLVRAARLAASETGGVGADADARKRLMIVPKCQVLELVTETQPDNWVRVTGVRVRDGAGNERVVPLAPPTPDGRQSVAVIALGTIESTRLALTTFPASLAGRAAARMGKNLMAHLRSNLTIRVPRAAVVAALPAMPPAALRALQVSALFVKGKANINGVDRYFHLQITASGLGRFGNDSEAELFKKLPSIEQMNDMLQADDTHVVITLRGIAEMTPFNPDSVVELATTPSDFENGRPRAFVDIGDSRQPVGGSPQTGFDRDLWEVMDLFTDEVAVIFANGQPIDIVLQSGRTIPVAAGAAAAAIAAAHPHRNRRDKLGTTHHEAGTLWMHDNPALGVTNDFGRIHDTTNCYVAGPALHPTSGSPNPMLTGVALARRTVTLLADNVLPRPQPFAPAAPWTALFDGTARSFNTDWARTSPNASNGFALVNGEIITFGSGDFGLLYYRRTAFADFTLRLQFRVFDPVNQNSGVFVRFRDPALDPTPVIQQRLQAAGHADLFSVNRAWSAVHSGFEIQIDDRAVLRRNRTGAIYDIPAGDDAEANQQNYQAGPNLIPGRWYEYVIDVRGNRYRVDLRDLDTMVQTRTADYNNADVDRGIPQMNGNPAGYIGLQSYNNAPVAFRRIEIRP
jgi:choline dehydrogenase-like flavoprotein